MVCVPYVGSVPDSVITQLAGRQNAHEAQSGPVLPADADIKTGTNPGGEITMLVAYLTTDEVNQDLAIRLASDCGITLWPLSTRDAPPNGAFNAVVYDWDYWPPEKRRELLAMWLAVPVLGCVAVHSYHLEEQEIEALARKGILVFHRLGPKVFHVLRRVIKAAGASLSARSKQPARSRPGC
jgi:hypothetical protein